MSRNQLRVTGFTRFVLAMLVILPLAYFGASYVTGESIDFKAKWAEWTGKETTTAPAKEVPVEQNNNGKTVNLDLKKKETSNSETPRESTSSSALSELNNKVYNLEQKLAAKEAELKAKNDKIEMLEDLIRLYKEKEGK